MAKAPRPTRGLATLNRTVEEHKAQASVQEGGRLDRLPKISIFKILPDAEQPREYFDDEKISDLIESIRSLGRLEEPIRVYPIGHGEFRVKDGHRRHRALSELAKDDVRFQDVPVIIEDAPEDSAAGRARLRLEQMITSLFKEKLTALETLRGYATIAEELAAADLDAGGTGEISLAELAARMGVNKKNVERHMRVARHFTSEEMGVLVEHYPTVGLDPLLALVDWLEGRYGAPLSDEQRLEAITHFSTVDPRPAARLIPQVLQQFAAVEKPKGRPRKKVVMETTWNPSVGFEAHVFVPTRKMSVELLDKAESELQKGLEKIRQLRSGTLPGA